MEIYTDRVKTLFEKFFNNKRELLDVDTNKLLLEQIYGIKLDEDFFESIMDIYKRDIDNERVFIDDFALDLYSFIKVNDDKQLNIFKKTKVLIKDVQDIPFFDFKQKLALRKFLKSRIYMSISMLRIYYIDELLQNVLDHKQKRKKL